jgi:formate--tetrahydrofolate ligase
MEKFLDIKCRKAGLEPSCVVLVATIRALKMHGGVAKEDLGKENVEALKKGASNLARHIENVKKFGVPPVVAINRFVADTDAELDAVRQICAELGVEAIECNHWAYGSAGIEKLAHAVVKLTEQKSNFNHLYPDSMPLWDKVRTIAQNLYGAQGIIADKLVRDRFHEMEKMGFGHYPVCMAKTQYSFSTDPNLKGAPSNHVVPIREVRLSAGAEFIVVICGEIMTMPGLPRVPSSNSIRLNAKGEIEGLS